MLFSYRLCSVSVSNVAVLVLEDVTVIFSIVKVHVRGYLTYVIWEQGSLVVMVNDKLEHGQLFITKLASVCLSRFGFMPTRLSNRRVKPRFFERAENFTSIHFSVADVGLTSFVDHVIKRFCVDYSPVKDFSNAISDYDRDPVRRYGYFSLAHSIFPD